MKFKFTLFTLFLVSSFFVSAQNSEHYYVIVGAFAQQNNAIKFTEYVNKQNYKAQYAINADRNLYYVYILDTEVKREAFAYLIKIKAESEFKQAWVFTGNLNGTIEVVKETIKEPEPVKQEVVVEKKEEPLEEAVIAPPAIDSSALVKVKPKPEGKPFFFKLTNGEGGPQIAGEVHVMTSSKAGQYQSFPANQLVYIKAPNTGILQIATLAAGYKEMKRSINYNDPSASAAELGVDQEAVIAFPLIRVNMGDYIEFSNVRFFQNSAILQPESKNELDGLIDLMKENLKYKIKVHGHCNGDQSRDIVSKGKSTDFFATDAANKKESASAKKLTEYRAEIVKDYLVSQGIEAGRIATKAEGGKAAIYPTTGTLAARNDRVEIEITKGKK